VNLVEMRQNHDRGLCCGAGGGRMWMEEHQGTRINVARTEQAIETQATTVAASCPFCITMLTDGVKDKDMVGKIQVKDIAEILDSAT
jgi:Fe-S oxidoreductase